MKMALVYDGSEFRLNLCAETAAECAMLGVIDDVPNPRVRMSLVHKFAGDPDAVAFSISDGGVPSGV